jgi:hypothetical protein
MCIDVAHLWCRSSPSPPPRWSAWRLRRWPAQHPWPGTARDSCRCGAAAARSGSRRGSDTQWVAKRRLDSALAYFVTEVAASTAPLAVNSRATAGVMQQQTISDLRRGGLPMRWSAWRPRKRPAQHPWPGTASLTPGAQTRPALSSPALRACCVWAQPAALQSPWGRCAAGPCSSSSSSSGGGSGSSSRGSRPEHCARGCSLYDYMQLPLSVAADALCCSS